jgi:1,4-dihydroxy-2-naphthoyl-CoA hydrolase
MERDEFILLAERLLEKTALAPLGARVLTWDPEALVVGLTIDDRHRQPMGWLHGGVSALLAESAASLAAAMSIEIEREEAFGVDLNITHLRSRRDGRVVATARPLHRGRTVHVYAVDVTDGDGALLAAARCTIAIRSRRQR